MGVSSISGWQVPRNKGQYTRKHYYCKSKIPGFVSALYGSPAGAVLPRGERRSNVLLDGVCIISCPEDSMVLIEEAWNAYPHCVTVITNGYLAKHKFYICIESMHLADRGDTENAVGMSNNELSQRKVEMYVPVVCREEMILAASHASTLAAGWTSPSGCSSRRCRTTATPPRYASRLHPHQSSTVEGWCVETLTRVVSVRGFDSTNQSRRAAGRCRRAGPRRWTPS